MGVKVQKWVKFQLKIFYCDLIGKLVNLVTKCFEKGGGGLLTKMKHVTIVWLVW